jgi:Raf kinase inhibitor-like YbhB/YbcL family protein
MPLLAALLAMATLQLTSPSFSTGASIPARYTCDGRDMSPPLQWTGVPAGVKSFALIVHDPDAPAGDWVHWVAYNIPSAAVGLRENQPKKKSLDDGTLQGVNDFGKAGYGGPCPPGGTHRYVFHLYALDALLTLPAGVERQVLEEAIKGHVLAEGELTGTYRCGSTGN